MKIWVWVMRRRRIDLSFHSRQPQPQPDAHMLKKMMRKLATQRENLRTKCGVANRSSVRAGVLHAA